MSELTKIYCAACGNCKLSKYFLNQEKTVFIKVVKCAKGLWNNARQSEDWFDYHTLAHRTQDDCLAYDSFIDCDDLASWLRELFFKLPTARIVHDRNSVKENKNNE